MSASELRMLLGDLWRRARSLARRSRLHDELAEEMELHVELRAAEYRARGMSASEALFAAKRRFGNRLALRERSADQWGWDGVERFAQDVRLTLRRLRRSPGFVLVVVATLGVCIALNTAAFALYRSIIDQPIGAPNSDALVRVRVAGDRHAPMQFAYTDFQLVQRNTRTLGAAVATSLPQTLVGALPLDGDASPRALTARFVSPNYFDALGVRMLRGRAFDDREIGAVVSHAFWTRTLRADSSIMGRTIAFRGADVAILGVAPASFTGTGIPASIPDVWMPATLQPLLIPGSDWQRDRTQRQWEILARRASNATTTMASDELTTFAAAMTIGDSVRSTPVRLVAAPATFFQADSGELETVSSMSVPLAATLALVLLIGGVNLVNLLSARNAAREREHVVRLALGASRMRVARQLLVETIVLGLFGGALGAWLAWWMCRWFQAWITSTIARLTGGADAVTLDVTFGWPVYLFTALLSLVVASAIGVWPALRAARTADASLALRQGGGGTDRPGMWRRRHLLLSAQIAASLVLLCAAGLLFGGVRRAGTVDPGFESEHVALLSLDVSGLTTDTSARAALLRRVADRVRAVPNIVALSWATQAPFTGHHLRTFRDSSGATLTFAANAVSAEYFATLRIPLVAGRTFTPDEVEQQRPVMVVSESIARRYWGRTNPVGRLVRPTDWLIAPDSQSYTIVGVARDIRHTFLSKVDAGFEYFPMKLSHSSGFFLLRTQSAPDRTFQSVLAAMAELDATLPTRVHVMTFAAGPLALQRLMTSAPVSLASSLALLGLLLASIGVFGVVAQVVARRTREIGIHVALGASRRTVLATVVGRTLTPVAWGAGAGLGGSIGVATLLSKLLAMPDAPDLTYGAGAFDPMVFVGVSLVLSLVVVLACWVPAHRALSVDPLEALRAE